MTNISVQCLGLRKAFDGSAALNGLNLDLMQGEILALLGPSGCGKTTLLRLISGLASPDSGSITIGGKTVAGPNVFCPPEERRIGLVFQNYALFPHLSVAENVTFGVRGDEKPEAARAILRLVGLNGSEERMPHELSGGEQQRVALARALAPEPDVMLLDEPFSNLDAGLRVRMREHVRAVLKVSGATAIFVTHDQGEALFMGDRVAVQNSGYIEQVGTPDSVFSKPATRFVAEFMGRTDFLPGKMTSGGVQTEIGLIKPDSEVSIGMEVDVVLRPDDVRIEPDPESSSIVLARHFRGMDNVYRVRLKSGRIIHSQQRHTFQIAPATPVRVSADLEHALVCFKRSDDLSAADLK